MIVLTSAPSEQATVRADYFDGKSSIRRNVELELGASLGFREDGVLVQSWAYETIRRADGPPGMLRLRSTAAAPLARVEIANQALGRQVVVLCPRLDADEPQRGQTIKIVGWSLAAVASIVLSVLFIVPYVADWATPLIPRSFDRWLGGVAEKQVELIFGKRSCVDDASGTALRKLAQSLQQASGFDGGVSLRVVQSPIPNAFALPGGRIFILSALLDKSEGVDELAGVLAHELGHVSHRDQVRAMLHNGGSAFLIGLLFGDVGGGGTILIATRSLFQSSYSRGVESQADDFAFALLHRLGRPSKPLGEFLVRLTKGKGAGPGALFDSHPVSEERLRRLGENDSPASAPPLLSQTEWQSLKQICASGSS